MGVGLKGSHSWSTKNTCLVVTSMKLNSWKAAMQCWVNLCGMWFTSLFKKRVAQLWPRPKYIIKEFTFAYSWFFGHLKSLEWLHSPNNPSIISKATNYLRNANKEWLSPPFNQLKSEKKLQVNISWQEMLQILIYCELSCYPTEIKIKKCKMYSINTGRYVRHRTCNIMQCTTVEKK